MRRVHLLAIIVAASMLACGFSVRAQEPLKIRIAWVVPVGNWASIIYEKKDLMTHYGKTYVVEPIHFKGTPPMITALAAGELDIADLAYSSFATAVENAGMKDLKFIADEAQDGAHGHDSGAFFVLKDGPIHKVADLKGKVIADVGAGSAVDIAIRVMLKKSGLETPRDYTAIEAGFPNMEALLAEKKADLVAGVQPFTLKPSFKAIARPLFTDVEALGGPTQFVIWTAHADYIAKHRAALVDMFEDAIRATRWLTDPRESRRGGRDRRAADEAARGAAAIRFQQDGPLPRSEHDAEHRQPAARGERPTRSRLSQDQARRRALCRSQHDQGSRGADQIA